MDIAFGPLQDKDFVSASKDLAIHCQMGNQFLSDIENSTKIYPMNSLKGFIRKFNPVNK